MKRLRQIAGWITLALLVGLVPLHFWLLDGLDGFLFSLVSEDSTVYASGYSDRSFRRVHVGMTSNEVVALLGSPLETGALSDEGCVTWLYSNKKRDTSYHVRTIVFQDGVVSEIISEFYLD